MIGPSELHTHAHCLGRREAQEQTETPTNGIDTDLEEQDASEEGGKEEKEGEERRNVVNARRVRVTKRYAEKDSG